MECFHPLVYKTLIELCIWHWVRGNNTVPALKEPMVNGLGRWVDGWLGGWLDVWLGRWLVGWVGGWLSGWMVGWLIGWLVGWVG